VFAVNGGTWFLAVDELTTVGAMVGKADCEAVWMTSSLTMQSRRDYRGWKVSGGRGDSESIHDPIRGLGTKGVGW
jgi:hypothetical protein